MKIKTGDMVILLVGKDRGKTGKVMQVFPEIGKVVVEGLNMMSKHLRGSKKQKGKKIDYPAPVNVSNVALVDKDGKPGRVGYEIIEHDGKKTKNRVLKKAGNVKKL
jgi:large subunit ribosomal protein L24